MTALEEKENSIVVKDSTFFTNLFFGMILVVVGIAVFLGFSYLYPISALLFLYGAATVASAQQTIIRFDGDKRKVVFEKTRLMNKTSCEYGFGQISKVRLDETGYKYWLYVVFAEGNQEFVPVGGVGFSLVDFFYQKVELGQKMAAFLSVPFENNTNTPIGKIK